MQTRNDALTRTSAFFASVRIVRYNFVYVDMEYLYRTVIGLAHVVGPRTERNPSIFSGIDEKNTFLELYRRNTIA